MGGILGFDSNKNTTTSIWTSIADSFNSSTSTVSNKENIGNTSISFGATGANNGVAMIPAIIAGGLVIAGLAMLRKGGGS